MPFSVPIELLNAGGETLWGNLGDWSAADDYPQAATALARRLGRAAQLTGGEHVVDAGCGAGDQLRIWIEDFGAGRVTAVEGDETLARRAAARVEAWGMDDRVGVRIGDAARQPLSDAPADCVLSLDAAYFFRPRVAFLEGARRSLVPGGILALADLTLGTGMPAVASRLLAPVCGVPAKNLLTPTRWVRTLSAAGFDEVDVRDCTRAVLVGFSEWIRGSQSPLRDRSPSPTTLALGGFGRVAGRLSEGGGLGYAIITARADGRPQ